ncbi:hypothetical protein ACKKBG_A04550 [Auxenochlorella protothecoides x Auxenochlorella symbiontica]
MDPLELPIRRFATPIAEAVRDNAVVVVIGETGSGKTTQISQILLDAGLGAGGMVGVTQPRRVAAVTVARRVAFERKVDVGQEVGYAVRFEECCSRRTSIKYLTDGTLLRELLHDPSLSRYGVIVLDEAHERSLNTDVLFALLKNLVARRDPPLKLVITSATLDSEKFSAYYGACPVFEVPGRAFPVEIVHSLDDHSADYLEAAVDTALDIHCNQPEGDILVFLTGQAEIDKAVRQLNAAVRALPADAAGDLLVLPIYAALPPDMQARVFRPAPPGTRRCIVATNIAETSVTVDGVVYVIDPGMSKQKDFNPATGLDRLEVGPISRVQATQRAGRAGRTRPGKCYRLYTQKYYERQMPNTTAPEIQRTSLAGVVLYLKSLPLNIDVLGFEYLDPPARPALEAALRSLYVLDAIDGDGVITDIGRRMAALPLTPSLSRALLAAEDGGCLGDMLSVAGMLSTESSVFLGGRGPQQLLASDAPGPAPSGRPPSRPGAGAPGSAPAPLAPQARAELLRLQAGGLGDHVFLLRLYRAWQAAGAGADWARALGVDARTLRFARDVRAQLERAMAAAEPGARGARSGESGAGLAAAGEGRPPRPAKRDADGVPRPQDAPGSRRGSNQDPEGRDGVADGGFLGGDEGEHRRLRHALAIGFANQLARRMPLHNGYRTLGDRPTLAQVHPSCARLGADEDGLLPEWVVYHELIATGHTFLSKVCAVEGAWVAALLPRLTGVDVARLSGGASTAAAVAAAVGGKHDASGSASGKAGPLPLSRRNSDADVSDARARFLARKSQRGG